MKTPAQTLAGPRARPGVCALTCALTCALFCGPLWGCVDKAPPPLWPAPPPPSIATPIGVTETAKPIVVAPPKKGEPDPGILDPENAAAGKAEPSGARPVPTHK